jgi:hypothetical protein
MVVKGVSGSLGPCEPLLSRAARRGPPQRMCQFAYASCPCYDPGRVVVGIGPTRVMTRLLGSGESRGKCTFPEGEPR